MNEQQVRDGINLMGQGMGYTTIAVLLLAIIVIFANTGKVAEIIELSWIWGFFITLSINYLLFRQMLDENADIQERKKEMIQW